MSNQVIAYVRVSGQSSVEASIPRQRELIKSYCVLKQLPEPTYIEDLATSGFKENRHGLQQLLDLCRKKQVSTVIVTDLSRLARNLRLTLEIIDLFVKHQITFISLTEDVRTDTSIGKFFISLCASFHEMVRNNISDRQRIAIKHKKSKNEKVGRFTQFGYDIKEKCLVPNANEQAVIQIILQLHRDHHSVLTIKKKLELRGITTKTGNTKWSYNVIRKIIQANTTKTNATNIA